MFCASISAAWDFSVNLLRSILLIYLTSALPNVYYHHIATSQGFGAGKSSEKRFETARAVITLAIDKQGWRAIYAPSDSAHEILPYAPCIGASQHFADQADFIETERRRVLRKALIIKSVLVFEQHVVHLPKPSLRAGCFGRFSRVFGVWVNVRQREVAKCKAQAIAQSALDRFDYEVHFTTESAFVITIFNECDRGIE